MLEVGVSKLVTIGLLLSTGCRQIFGFEAVSVPADAIEPDTMAIDAAADAPVGWRFRKQITIAADQVAGPLVDFPLLVRLATDAELAASARDDGFDLRFTADDGTSVLSHELERFDGNTGELVAWVRMPALSDTADTVVYLYFGNPAALDQQDVTGVWSASFVGVWHLDEASGTAIADSTSHARTGTKTSATTPSSAAGVIGGGQLFSGLTDGIAIGNAADLDIPTITFETWIRVAGCDGDVYRRIVDFTVAFTSSWVVAYPCTGAPTVNQKSVMVDLPSGARFQTPINSFTSDVAHHLVFKSDPAELWIDGVQHNLTAAPFGLAQNNVMTVIGNREGSPDRAVLGLMDEVRISNVRRTPDFIVTSFNNQRPGSTMLTVGPVEPAP
jgi:MSHA biogenesis protein MshQ